MSFQISGILILSACLTILCGCAMQQDVITLDDRITLLEERLEQRNVESEKKSAKLKSRMEDYGKTLEEKEHGIRNQYAGLHVMLDSLREEIQLLGGKLEEVDYLLKQKATAFKDSDSERQKRLDRIEKVVNLNKDRVVRIEQYLNFESSGPDLKIEAEGRAEKELSENEVYAFAKQAFDQGDFETAREGFQKLIRRHPKSERADNAQFWIGESYYREKWYEKAILEYQKVIEKYPKGNKVQASLLKQGFAFLNLGDKPNSRLILKELIKKYPESNEAKIARQKLEGLK